MRSYGIVGIPDDEMHISIKAQYGEGTKATYAQQVAEIAGEFTRFANASINRTVRDRREYRRKCRDYVLRESKARIQPVGFLADFIFMTIIGGIVSWVVHKLMDKYFGEK